MIDWRRGGWTGSLNRWVQREVREHMKSNAAAKRCRYSIPLRALRYIFSGRTFGQFVAIYIAVAVFMTLAEVAAARFLAEALPAWTRSGLGLDIKMLLMSVASYLIAAQVGVLGVISIAVALVTVIAQREGSGSDVQLYYHESLAFEVVASSIALLAALCAQLLWPLQFFIHRLGEGTDSQVFKLALLALHIAWLLLNLSVLAHFVATTFRFVQQPAREQLRERYIANVVAPVEMTERLRLLLYERAGSDLVTGENDEDGPTVLFGFDSGTTEYVELEHVFAHPVVLYDVRMAWLQWALRRWWARCQAQRYKSARRLGRNRPALIFTLRLDTPLQGKAAWCQRSGGVSLDALERRIIGWSFRFKRPPHEA